MQLDQYTKLLRDGNLLMNEILPPNTNLIGNYEGIINLVELTKDKILSAYSELQKLVVDRLVMKFLRYQPKFIIKEFMLYCQQLGISINTYVLEKKSEMKQVEFEINYIALNTEQRQILIYDMLHTDFDLNNMSQYADRKTRAEEREAAERSRLYSTMSNADIDSLRLLYSECKDEVVRKVILRVVNQRRST